jgi:hypothetical protein
MVTFTPAPGGWRTWRNIAIDEIEVKHLRDWEHDGALKVLLAGVQLLDRRPKVTRENLVVVPKRERQAAEEAIEIAANLIAVAQGCRRVIESPTPYVGFIPQSDAARRWLEDRAGLLHRQLQGRLRLVRRVDLGKDTLSALADRTEGVALLVEALAQDHATGQFHDFIRLFEHAFALPPRKLTAPLSAFLHPRFGYTRDEVAVWLEQYRDAVTHADTRNKFLLETDVRPVIDRMEQVATDVLFNKLTWRDHGSARRELWTPPRGQQTEKGASSSPSPTKTPLCGQSRSMSTVRSR